MNMISKMLLSAATVVALTAVVERSAALPTVGVPINGERKSGLKTTAAACNPATATIDLDINNVRARMMDGGDMWWDRGTGTASYEVPKGSGKNSLFAGSIWVAGYDEQHILKVAGQTYRQKGNDYWPGPTQIDKFGVNLAPDKATCSDWDKFWKIDRATLLEFRELQRQGASPEDQKYQSILQWPAMGNESAVGTSGLPLNQLSDVNYATYGRNYAPFVNVGGDPNKYEPNLGDYPDILGDQFIWWVFNDMGNVKLQSESVSIGMEVQTSAFAFSSKDYLNDATFIFYKLINRGVLNMDSTYMATWTDADLGYAFDDYLGCDTGRSLGILYNGKSIDGNGAPTDYGSQVPMVGVDFFIGPKRRTYGTLTALQNQFPGHVFHSTSQPGRYFNEDTLGMTVFNYFNNGTPGPLTDPQNGLEMYRVMTGYNRIGQHLKNDQASCPNSTAYNTGPEINYVWPGNPERAGDWSECQCNTLPGDRRFVHSSGPFKLEAGGITNDIIIGACWVPNVGGCPNTSFSRIRAADDMIQDLFDNHFRTIEGPEAPRMVVREMDRKLVFYLINDSVSTNFREQFGYSTDPKYRVSTPRTRRLARNGDSLYKFEGYRVFQLKNSTVSVANIFGTDGQVDQSVAREVFESDIKNGVKGNIINYVANPDKTTSVIDAQVKVTAKDSGIQHSFVLTTDAFATGDDKRFVNYKTYYFVALAYAYNNYMQFRYDSADYAQTIQYLESSHAAGGRNISVVPVMPNEANGDMGTYLNADYGSGISIVRLEGIGNGANGTSFTQETENIALTGPAYQAVQPKYDSGQGPVKIKVVDPQKVLPLDWTLYIQGPSYSDTTKGVVAANSKWLLVSSNRDTVYSENSLAIQNEQILEKYGLSVNIAQTLRPGDAGAPQNGLISSDITFADPNNLWLAGVPDGEQTSVFNWIRSGCFEQPKEITTCNYADNGAATGSNCINPDQDQIYENLIPGSTQNKSTWAPVTLGVVEARGDCGFGVVNPSMQRVPLTNLQGIDVVFTSDKTKWSRCLVMEMQDDPSLSEGHATKFSLRSHKSWTGQVDNNGNPVYSTTQGDTGFSYFPGYAINTETGERLNMVFGEDSYLKQDNGGDMIWNPSSRYLDPQGGVIFGGKHYIYVLGTRYDEDKALFNSFDAGIPDYRSFRWMSLPTTARLLPLSQGLIPTTARVRIRVTTPYGRYIPETFSGTLQNDGFPLYTFSTKHLASAPITDVSNPYNSNTQAVLDKIAVTPNPYYGYTPYETGRLNTKVLIVNLPRKATINIYSTDGTLIRTLTKDDPSVSYIEWDTRNSKGLSIASGMYLFHIKAETNMVDPNGNTTTFTVGEKIIRWFGAMRPVDLTTH
jgi:hypothetical protein